MYVSLSQSGKHSSLQAFVRHVVEHEGNEIYTFLHQNPKSNLLCGGDATCSRFSKLSASTTQAGS